VYPAAGKVLSKLDLPDDVFAEGVTIVDDTLFQLTYQKQIVYRYDINNLSVPSTTIGFGTDTGQGWGLTSNRTHLIGSDGTDVL
jgi:glutamine cyclotransferase